MLPYCFVDPETKTLTLANGHTLVVKKRLNAGEERRAMARMYLATAEGRVRVDPFQTGLATITAFLLDWSLTDSTGAREVIKGVPIDELEAKLDALDPDVFTAIKNAVEDHEAAMAEERAAEKKRLAGASASSATLPSPDTTAGATSGSAPSTPTSTT